MCRALPRQVFDFLILGRWKAEKVALLYTEIVYIVQRQVTHLDSNHFVASQSGAEPTTFQLLWHLKHHRNSLALY